MQTKGGRITLSFNGQSRSTRGEAELLPAAATVDAGVNQDGSGYATVAPQLMGANIRLDRGSGLYWTDIELLRTVNVTLQEIDVGLTHFFTEAAIVGQPTINTATGEVTGLSIRTDKYRALPS